MKKYVILAYGYTDPTPEMMQGVRQWFDTYGDRVVDSGNPISGGRELTHNGTSQLTHANGSASGYMIINAANLDEAEQIVKEFPIIDSLHVYETVPMD